MEKTIKRLHFLLEKLPEEIQQISEADLSRSSSAEKWSKKEVLGHLCDSALHNYQRFVRVQFEPQPFLIIPYDQKNWVAAQRYRQLSSDDIVKQWIFLNRQILRVLSALPDERYALQCQLAGESEVHDLRWLVRDYLRHLEHHLSQIFELDRLG